MKTWRFFKTAAAGGSLCFLSLLSIADSQDRPPASSPRLTPQPSAEEKFLFDAANRERAADGERPLEWDSVLAVAARQHVLLMAQQYLLSHEYPGEPALRERAAQAGAKFAMIAENIAVGPNPEAIHSGWMHSPGHRRNMLNPQVTAVGIATIRGGGGLFAVQDFSRPVEDLSLKQQEEKVLSLLKKTGLQAANITDDAPKTCAMERGFAGDSVLFVIRFEASDLSKLPDELTQKIKGRAYRRAAVGACRNGDTAGFTLYRIAVLLN